MFTEVEVRETSENVSHFLLINAVRESEDKLHFLDLLFEIVFAD